LYNAQAFEHSTSNSLRQSVESTVAAPDSAGTAQIIRLVERLRDLQRIVLPTQVIEAPDGYGLELSLKKQFDTASDTKRLKRE
jgi:hypothetical protein